MEADVIVAGAGVAGLRCARCLHEAGAEVLVLDRSPKVGGRCATRLFDGQPVDYGPLFLHGTDPSFLEQLLSLPGAQLLRGWPSRVEGRGTPCQPGSLGEEKVAFAQGVNAFPQALAAGLPMRLATEVTSVSIDDDGVEVGTASGQRLRGRDLVLAMALEQSVPFVRMLPAGRSRDGVVGLLETLASVPSLTVIAGYAAGTRAPAWDVCYPETGGLQLIGNESSKRPAGRSLVLVHQARPLWSHQRLEHPPEEWSRALLEEAAKRLGDWAARPEWTHPHRWRYARFDGANKLAAPLVLRFGRCRVGLAGDAFDPAGGAQAAWLSGGRLASLLS